MIGLYSYMLLLLCVMVLVNLVVYDCSTLLIFGVHVGVGLVSGHGCVCV